MKARIDLNYEDGTAKIFVEEGTYEEAKEFIKKIMKDLSEEGIKFSEIGEIERHVHTGETVSHQNDQHVTN